MITKQASFRFYAELNDFIKSTDRFHPIFLSFKGRQTVKHLVESLGVPHPEIDLILANGHSVPFGYIVQNGDHISVYPVFESINITAAIHLRPQPLRIMRFILDGHLGKLSAFLRMLGFDANYLNDFPDDKLVATALEEERILLTRDRGLLKRKQVTRGYCLRSLDPYQQLIEVIRRFDLADDFRPFTRCMTCNGILEAVKKKDILPQLEPRTRKYFTTFKQCENCSKIYWQGSHHQRMQRLIDNLTIDL